MSTDRTFEKTDGKKKRASGQEERQCEDEAALWAAPESHTDHRGLRGQPHRGGRRGQRCHTLDFSVQGDMSMSKE